MHSTPYPEEPRDTWVFAGFIALLAWAPLPLASNRTWALGILLLWMSILLVGCAWAWRGHMELLARSLARFRLPLLVLAAYTSWATLLAIPIPAPLARLLSPEAFRVYRQVGSLAQSNFLPLSLDPFQANIYAATSFLYFAAFLLSLLLARNPARLTLLAKALVLSGLFQALLGIVLFSLGAHYQLFFNEVTHDRVLGTYRNPNDMAGYMELCLSMGIGLMLAQLGHGGPRHKGWKQKLLAVLGFILSPKMRLRLMLVIMVIALVLTRSRMGNSAFFAAMLIVGSIAIVLKRRAAPAAIWLIASLIAIDILVVGTWIGLEKVVSRVQETSLMKGSRGAEESVEERSVVPRAALALIKDFPVAGTGGWSFYNSFFRYRPPQITAFFEHTHNDYVEVACDTGLVGLALLMASGIAAAWAFLSVLYTRQNALARGIAFGSLMALVCLAIHGTVDFNLQIPANALTLTVILAMGWIAAALPSGRRHHPPVIRE